MSPQAQDPRWVAFADREPPEDRAVNGLNPNAMITRTVLVTNNLHATCATGCMSHLWFAMPIKSRTPARTGQWVAFDEGDLLIQNLTHWLDPFELPGEKTQ